MTENKLTDFSTLALGEEGHTTTVAGEEDIATHAETERRLQATTLPVSEETSSFTSGEEFTTEALGEEGPTTTNGENPSPADFSRKGGPFGAY
jgi:hypothetical protein